MSKESHGRALRKIAGELETTQHSIKTIINTLQSRVLHLSLEQRTLEHLADEIEMGDDLNPSPRNVSISVRKRMRGYFAALSSHPNTCATGDSVAVAVGNLILDHTDKFYNVTITNVHVDED